MRIALILLLFLLNSAVFAAERVRVLALFPGKAMLEIDGQRKVLAEGQTHKSGVKLLSANPQQARVLINGEERELRLGSAVSASFAQAAVSEIRLLGHDNRFQTDGLINGQPVRMLVDTGATSVALSETTARRLGVQYASRSQQIRIGTASGTALGYEVRLRSLKVGDQIFNNVRAMVVQGDSPREVLLGMNILEQFEIEQRKNLMILRRRR